MEPLWFTASSAQGNQEQKQTLQRALFLIQRISLGNQPRMWLFPAAFGALSEAPRWLWRLRGSSRERGVGLEGA